MEILAAKKLSDTDLTAALYKAIASERSHVADSIACLIEITARDLHTRLGASSLFVYLTRDLKLSESSASKRDCRKFKHTSRSIPQPFPPTFSRPKPLAAQHAEKNDSIRDLYARV